MKGNNFGMILTAAIAAPLMIICCGGGLALIGFGFGGVAGFLTGSNILGTALFALLGGALFLTVRKFVRARNSETPTHETKEEDQIERQAP